MEIIIAICIVIIVVLLLWIKLENKRAAISVLIGLAAGVLSFFAFIAFLFAAPSKIVFLFLLVFYVSLLVFLFLWNLTKSKAVYLILSVPFISVAAIIAVFLYRYSYIDEIPTVSEESYQYKYRPFAEDNKLTKLDEKLNLTLTDKLPVLDGATALYPVYASFAQAAYQKNEYGDLASLVLVNTTPRAYDNLLKNKADIIFCAAPSDAQKKQFSDNGVNLKLVPIGREAFVFFVNKRNIVDNVTIRDIQEIYSGKIKNWKKLNGANQKIRAFQRPKDSGSQTALEKIMSGFLIMEPRREEVSGGMGGIINQVAVYRNFPNAIGYSFLFYSTEMVKNDQIKLLSVEGVYPSRETIQNGTYPFSDSFYAIYIDTADKNENIELFIEWILSEQGQELVEKTGYTPITGNIGK
jgi:phosphate transport system substrate-binding protein